MTNGKRDYKRCTKCGEHKPLTEYSHKRAKGRKPGLQPRCRSCACEDTKEWYENNKAKAKDTRLKSTYGISLNEYEARLLAQNNTCPICSKEFSFKEYGPNSPVVDHCHTSGAVRGIICNECNRGLGYFRDNKSALKAAIKYLENN